MKTDAEVIDCTMEETKVCISETDFLKDLVQKFFMQATFKNDGQSEVVVAPKKEKTRYLYYQQC